METLGERQAAEGSSVTGSWFPTGYYGHFRCRPRENLDYQADFRRLASPPPPLKLDNRLQVMSIGNNPFSVHDNKHTFCNDGLYFGQGLGKRRVPGRSGQCKPNLIAWNTSHRRTRSAMPMYHGQSLRDLPCPPQLTHRSSQTAPGRIYRPPSTSDMNALESSYQRTFRSGARSAHPLLTLRNSRPPSGSSTSSQLPFLTPSNPVSPPPTSCSSRPRSLSSSSQPFSP